ncbi:aminotransferase class I/II-fold pyridoxal phosphate-dependent enzyme [Alicyclobacillus sp. SO9]|nr:aminotransferase class I/II-fold pyridoxal phosphate-dependent enzyme [Alicyclobacillus sp. SO9]
MEDVISLGVGEPDFVTPWHVRDSAIYALEQGHTSYTSNRGLFELREAITEYLKKFNLDYSPEDEILVTIGGSEAIDVALRAVISPGDEVLIPEPAYVSYRPCALLAGAQVTAVETKTEDNFQLTADLLENSISSRTKAVILSFPNNPTGAVMSRDRLIDIAKVIRKNNIFVISDEIYAELTYSGHHCSIASLPGMRERTIVINGMSKAFAMTGWRLGYAAAPKEILDAMLKIHQYTILCAPVMVQMAALEALKNGLPEVHRMVEKYDQRRHLIVDGLREIGLPCHNPGGAFYAFADIRATGLTSEEFAEGLLREARVAVVPGNVFGNAGEGFVRCSYATSVDRLETALVRIDSYVKSIR